MRPCRSLACGTDSNERCRRNPAWASAHGNLEAASQQLSNRMHQPAQPLLSFPVAALIVRLATLVSIELRNRYMAAGQRIRRNDLSQLYAADGVENASFEQQRQSAKAFCRMAGSI